ncbi:MAG: DUF1016 family protein [Armatimonadetes bacterium]|nr:DUF1016 family protein [Armatimonadota bacterium]
MTNPEYADLLAEIKTAVAAARLQAARMVNRELVGLYWHIGESIANRQQTDGYGKAVVERLSSDLRQEFPGVRGFSSQNLWYMRQLVLEYRSHPILQQLVGELPWGHNLLILAKVKSIPQKEFYLRTAAANSWSRSALLNAIVSDAYARQLPAQKQHNFHQALPAPLAEQAAEALKDVYLLDFLGITRPVVERELERRMIERIKQVLMEFGKGFCFISSQHKIVLQQSEYFIDLLFYHRGLCALVAVELKAGEFKPEYVGKMNFYLNLLDDFERAEHENPSVGIILCASKQRIAVEYALRKIDAPMGVASYVTDSHLPAEILNQLPDPRALETEILQAIGSSEEATPEEDQP